MTPSARHTPPGDKSFVTSLATHLAAGMALVLVVAAAFWGLGQVQGTTAGDPTIQPPEIVAGDDPADEVPDAPDTTGDEDPIDEPVDTSDPSDGDDPGEVDEPDPVDEPDAQFSPSDISIQVLDAAGDGGERMRHLVAQLRADGYRVVATNQARRLYERSTVFYSPGAQDKAEFVRSEYPVLTIVDEKPSNLTASVEVHIVVGQDYPAP